MAEQALKAEQIFVNQNRVEASKWSYKIVSLDERQGDNQPTAQDEIGELSRWGWEPCMMSSRAILLRRDATNATIPDPYDPWAFARSNLIKTFSGQIR